MRVRVIKTIDQCKELEEDWNRLLRPLARTVDGIGFNATLEWTLSLWENHLQSQPQYVFVLEDAEGICAILPCQQTIVSRHGLREIIIEPITELCSHRTGFLLRDAAPEYLEALLEFLYSDFPGWDSFRCHLVDGSISQEVFTKLVEGHGYPIHALGQNVSPFIALPEDREAYFSGLSKNFRDNLKKSEKRLNKSGKFEVRFYQSPHEVDEFIEQLLTIERRSWKEEAGTSITTNPIQEGLYRRFIPRAADKGWLLGTVLSLDEVPLAYAMGFVFENVYYNEKASYDESTRATGAGSYIYAPIIDELYRRGIRIFDFMGKCEDFKMRWTDQSYSSTSYVLYNRGVRAGLLRARHKLVESLKGTKSLSAD
jgi:hypothetical protein